MMAFNFDPGYAVEGVVISKWGHARCQFRCAICNELFTGTYGCLRLCEKHAKQRAQQRTRAIRAVQKAVREGRLPHISTLYCVDCGAFAHQFEHRSYSVGDELQVEPTCTSCNQKRGPASWSP